MSKNDGKILSRSTIGGARQEGRGNMPPKDTQKQHAAREEATGQPERAVPGEKPTFNVMEVLETHRNGASLSDAQEALQNLVAAVAETKRKGKITIEISAECRTPGSAKLLEVGEYHANQDRMGNRYLEPDCGMLQGERGL